MKSRIAVAALLLASLILGCSGQMESKPQTAPQTAMPESINIEDINVTQELQELEQLLQELENLDAEFNV
uniref:Lipoprotein n=1 Tax=Archaeoglobus fulgidus TaxID=2234 RepID=A0A7C3RE29_ARCFL